MKKSKHTLDQLLIQREKLEKQLQSVNNDILIQESKDVIEINFHGNYVNFSGPENIPEKPEEFKYNKEGKWKDKVLWVLIKLGIELDASEITRRIYKQEDNEEVDYTPIVRLTINRMVKKNELKKFKKRKPSNFYYALPDWKIEKE